MTHDFIPKHYEQIGNSLAKNLLVYILMYEQDLKIAAVKRAEAKKLKDTVRNNLKKQKSTLGDMMIKNSIILSPHSSSENINNIDDF